MSRIFIIARQEFIKFVTRRGFLFTLIGVPVWIGLAAVVPPMLASSQTPKHAVFTVIDRNGAFEKVLEGALARSEAQGRYNFALIDPAPELRQASPENFSSVAGHSLQDADGRLDAIVVIPKDFDASHPAQFWSTRDDPALRDFVQAQLTEALRLRALHGLDDAHMTAMLDMQAQIVRRTPQLRGDNGAAKAVSLSVSIGSAVLLLIVAMMNSTALLQGVIEEKSTRMIEVLLSCATPWEIVTGKIVGVVAVALFTVVLWVSSAVLLGMFAGGHTSAAFVVAALHALADPVLLLLILLYFLCGLLIYGAIFLAIGSMSASLADAQAYLGPSMMLIMLPNLFIGALLLAPNGPLATAISYFPIYTPYVMLMRIGSHPPVIEIVTTLLLSIGLAVFLVWAAGSIFARHALTTEKPAIRHLFGRAAKP